MTTPASGRPVRRWKSVRSSLTVGVMKEKEYGLSSALPAIDFAAASIVTSYFVAKGSGVFGSGVKISVVVPDQRNVPLIAGSMWNQGTVRSFGTFATGTIGS